MLWTLTGFLGVTLTLSLQPDLTSAADVVPSTSSSSSSPTMLRSFLSSLVSSAEKAANLARACRQERELFQLLIEEKHGPEKNAKFQHDFKTLADVLIQETLRHDLAKKYPQLAENIQGEESSHFTNTLGETIVVEVKDTEQETAAMLERVLDKNCRAAKLLAKEVHRRLEDELEEAEDMLRIAEDLVIDVDELAIWIDPIDSTSSYVSCTDSSSQKYMDLSIKPDGLQVVTVLIGVFNRRTGQPVVGVVNQPFANFDPKAKSWSGQVYWGVSYNGHAFFSSSLTKDTSNNGRDASTERIAVISSAEGELVKSSLSKKYDLRPARGAGYKLLCVALGHAGLYVTEKPSTFKWDSCAGHAILKSLGGNCLDLKATLMSERAEEKEGHAPKGHAHALRHELTYHVPLHDKQGVNQWSNNGGVLAFRSLHDLDQALALLREEGRERRAEN